MLEHYFKISIRNIIRDKGYSAVNIWGLSIAIACCLLLLFWIRFELSYESYYPNAGRIYRLLEVEQRNGGIHYNSFIRPGLSKEMKNTFPQIEAIAAFHYEELPFVTEDQVKKDGIMANMMSVEKDFLKMFAFEYVEGSPQSVIKENGAIITQDVARKFFGKESPVGKSLIFGSMLKIHISAVVKKPQNTHVKFDILVPSAREQYGAHYIMLKSNAALTPKLEKDVGNFLSTIKETKNKLVLQPIKDMHLRSPKEVTDSSYGSLAQIFFFSVVVVLVLVMAVINYVNTSIARSLSRMKEVGVRKVAGAERRELIERFLFESFILSFISMLLALAFVELLFPKFSEIMGSRISLSYDWLTILISLFTCVIITLLSGGYSAFYLSSFNPILIFRGGSKSGSKDGLRKILIGFQFFLSVSVLTCTVFIYKQINAIFTAETGVDRNNVIVLETSLWYDAESYIQIIKSGNPNIIDATIALCAPYNASFGYSGVKWDDATNDVLEMEFNQIFCDHNYASTFGLQVVQGEFIPAGLTWWQYSDEKTSFNIVINESFKKLIGKENPVGTTVTYAFGMRGRIIGVVKDFNFKPLKEPITPLIISFNPESSMNVYIKTTGKDKQATLDYILKKYKEMKPDYAQRPVMYHTVEDEYNKMYEVELRTAGILSVFSVISFLLSLLGIISMISFMIEKKTKEIAIRRINGASLKHIIILFGTDILKVAAIVSAFSIPICYIIMSRWLETYVYRTALSWWIFLAIPIALMLVTLLVIAAQVCLTARRNPVESLRNE